MLGQSKPRKGRRLLWITVLWLGVPLLLWWALRSVPLQKIWETLQGLALWQIAALLLLNVAVMLTFSGRWWFILRGLGYSTNYLTLAAYRLSAFGVSYFTPGPQFGGEPLQVYAVTRNENVPGTTSAAAVALDKLLEMVVNFAFIATGVVLTLQVWTRTAGLSIEALGVSLFLLMLPVGYLIATWRGMKPLTWILHHLPRRYRDREGMQRLERSLAESESQAGNLIRERPASLIYALLISLVSWGGQMLEYWLSAHFLGLSLTPLQLVSIMTAAYAAFLSPLPGGLGALEAGQVWMLEALGLDPAVGLSIALIIRARDVLFGVTGLSLAGMMLGDLRGILSRIFG